MTTRTRLFQLILLLFVYFSVPSFTRGQEIVVASKIVDGAAPGIIVKGLPADSKIVLHVVRQMEKFESDDSGNWQRVKKPLHAWAEFMASEEGIVTIDTAVPLAGTYNEPDPLALLRTGYFFNDPNLSGVYSFENGELEKAALDSVLVMAENQGSIVARSQFKLISEIDGLEFETVSLPGLSGVFARPGKETKLPVVITLHGSEGGSAAKARTRAAQFASNGFAALAVNYFAYAYEGIDGVPETHIETPIETIDRARAWLADRTDIDMQRVSLYGVSKGAEFALIAATQYDWIESVVAVVPSDVIWAGYGDDQAVAIQESSWSFEGKPLPFVPLFGFDPAKEGLYRTNTERYSRSRLYYSSEAAAAIIPIEKTTARILLLASDRDEVWASGDMARNLVERMVDAGKPDQVSVKIFSRAGHQIAGTGTFPIRLYGVESGDPNAKDIVAEGEAAAISWKSTLEFLNRNLSKRQ